MKKKHTSHHNYELLDLFIIIDIMYMLSKLIYIKDLDYIVKDIDNKISLILKNEIEKGLTKLI